MFVLLQLSCFEIVHKIIWKLNQFFSDNWLLAVLELSAGRWTVEACMSNIAYLKSANAKGKHILMKPVNEECYMLADDISLELLNQHHKTRAGLWKKGRLIVETSPNNYQVWVKSNRPLIVDEKKFWLHKMHSDPGASPLNRWGRTPGFRNRKDKYKTGQNFYPLAKLIWIDWKHKAIVPYAQKDKADIFYRASPIPSNIFKKTSTINRQNYEKGNESVTDFSYALALARRDCDAITIETRLLEERQNWKNHKSEKQMKDYLKRTVRKAMKIVENS
jgi:hypothetical protein